MDGQGSLLTAPVSPASGSAGAQLDQPSPRRHLVFGIVAIGLLMSSVDQTIVATALPTIQHDLHASINWSGWTITIYALGQIIALPLAGAISDQFGRKKVFLLAAVLFTVTSLACGLSTSIYELVPLRALQALGGGAFLPSASGIVSDLYGPERDRALGMFTSIFPIGGVAGPVLGGVFVTYWSWRGIFLVNVPLGVLLVTLGARFIPRGQRSGSAHIDVLGVTLLGSALLAGMFGIGTLGSGGATLLDPRFLLCEIGALGLGAAFVRHIQHTSAPFIATKLLYGRGFLAMNLINLMFGSAVLGMGALVPLYAQERFHIGSLSAGSLLTARAVGMICVAGLAVLALRRSGYRRPMAGGFLLLAVGLAVISLQPHGFSAYVWIAGGSALAGLGMGLSLPAANNAMLQMAPTQIAAVAGLRGMFRQTGGIIAVSVTTAALARSNDPGIALGHVFLIFAGLVLLTLPTILLVPEFKGSW